MQESNEKNTLRLSVNPVLVLASLNFDNSFSKIQGLFESLTDKLQACLY